MIETEGQIQIITCDKCKRKDSASESNAGVVFFRRGWALQPNAKKYKHLCCNCQTKKQNEAHSFVAANFKL